MDRLVELDVPKEPSFIIPRTICLVFIFLVTKSKNLVICLTEY